MLFCPKSTNKHFKIHRRYTGKGIPKQEKTHVPRSDAQDTLWKMRIIDSCYRKDLQSNSSSPSAPPKESTTPGDRNIFSSSIEPWYGERRLSQSRLWRFPREPCPDQKICRYELVEQPTKMLVLEDIRSAEQWDETGVALSSTLDGTVNDDQSEPKDSSNSAMFTKCDWKHFGIMLSYLRRQLMKNIVFIS